MRGVDTNVDAARLGACATIFGVSELSWRSRTEDVFTQRR
jgi:hypothetical protein